MDDYYCIDELSDNEPYESSSDDEDFRRLFTGQLCDDNNDDDFEVEMEKERDDHINGIHINESINNEQLKDNNDDDLFYDPESDDRDQKWVNDQRVASGNARNCHEKSDATLNCPCCMSLLCLDCQRHEIYKTQYRAMFVFNCAVDFTQKLQYKTKARKSRNRICAFNSDHSDTYYSVKCSVCHTQVAVYDNDEVYHFFNVLSGHN